MRLSNPKTNATPGHSRCKCGSCGEVFSGLSAFDKHRIGDHQEGKQCTDPATVDLEIREAPSGTDWGEQSRNLTGSAT